jgi:hypothetical protein
MCYTRIDSLSGLSLIFPQGKYNRGGMKRYCLDFLLQFSSLSQIVCIHGRLDCTQ